MRPPRPPRAQPSFWPRLELRYDPVLPVVQRREEIAAAIRENQVVVVCGETGSGKTTQLPKICLEIGRAGGRGNGSAVGRGMIGHTQPRRIAARAVAMRIAEELGTSLGHHEDSGRGGRGGGGAGGRVEGGPVGYKVRFHDRTGPGTLVKLMTDGILLAETVGDRLLTQYDTIIIDEAHERSLNIDFLLGYIRQLLPKRPDLKVIVTSATIDPERFAQHFADARTGKPAPIVEVSGRMFPVEVRYRPPPETDEEDKDFHFEDHLLDAIDELCRVDARGGEGGGDILVFLPGEREIRETAEALRKHHEKGTEILPLYARLSAAEQMRVFQRRAGRRRIVLATNIAETSLTVPGIRFVVDPGLARISRYSPRTKVQRLPIEPISRASADQRKGRCGRVAEGVCIRLYSEEDFEKRLRFTEPEVLRTNLASVILQMKSLGLGEVTDFPFVERPDGRLIRDGYDTLFEVGAVDEEGAITETGRRLAKLPLDPRIGRMILAAGGDAGEHALSEVLVIAAALSVQDPRERPLDQQDAADAAHERFKDESSDFLAMLKLWKFFREQREKLSQSQLRKLCRTNFLSYVRMREWMDVHQQLHSLVKDIGFRDADREARGGPDYGAVHRSLLAGMLSGVGYRSEAFEYSGPRGVKFAIHPGSGLFKAGGGGKSKWVMAAELVRTTKLYARGVAKIEPEWIESVGAHLVKRTYSEPHWEPRTQNILAFERVTLFGLEVVARRRVHYGPIDPGMSRELFIHHALVEGELRTTAEFMAHNLALEEEVQRIEHKLRRHDLLADVTARYAFYDRRVPPGIFNGSTFEKWRKEAEHGGQGRRLFMAREDLLVGDASEATPENFPDRLALPGPARASAEPVAVDYRAEPGHPEDGVTLKVPLGLINRLEPARAEWLVPGMLKEKVTELLRTLPKNLRTSFVPAPQWAERVVTVLNERQAAGAGGDAARQSATTLVAAVASALGTLSGVRVEPQNFQPALLPDHLKMNVKVLDEEGRLLTQGRDINAVKRELASKLSEAFEGIDDPRYNRDDVTEWDFGDLPEAVERKKGDMPVIAYPAIVALKQKGGAVRVGLRLMQTRAAALASMRSGLRRLFMLEAHNELRHWRDHLPGFGAMALKHAPIGPPESLRDDILELAVDRAYISPARRPGVGGSSATMPTADPRGDAWVARSEAEFRARCDAGWRELPRAVREACEDATAVLDAFQEFATELTQPPPTGAPTYRFWQSAAIDAREQVIRLVPRGFLLSTPAEWVIHLPRYIKGATIRLRRLAGRGTQTRGVGGSGLPVGEADALAMRDIAELWERYAKRETDLGGAGSEHIAARASLVRYRWMVEELRVSLFAQDLRTPMTVSVKRLEKQWEDVQKEERSLRETVGG